MDQFAKLFKMWKQRPHHDVKTFLEDGIIDPSKWSKANTKLMILMKEYIREDYSDLREAYRQWIGYNKSTLQKLYLIAYACHNPKTRFPITKRDWEKAHDFLRSSAIVNIKKSNGKVGSDPIDISYYACKDSDLLMREIDLINPDIIACAGTRNHLNIILNKDINYKCLDLKHPAMVIPYRDYFKQIKKQLKIKN